MPNAEESNPNNKVASYGSPDMKDDAIVDEGRRQRSASPGRPKKPDKKNASNIQSTTTESTVDLTVDNQLFHVAKSTTPAG